VIGMPVDLGEVDAASLVRVMDPFSSGLPSAARRRPHAARCETVGLLGGAAALNVEGREEERLVLHDRTAEGESDLLLVEGEIGIGRAVAFSPRAESASCLPKR